MILVAARIKLRAGMLPTFRSVIQEETKILEKYGMKLLGSYAVEVGPLNEVLDLWEAPDYDSLRAAGADPDLVRADAKLANAIEWEKLEILTKLEI